MPRNFAKTLKKSEFMVAAATMLLYLYLKFVYLTSRQQFIFQNGAGDKERFIKRRGSIFAFWHNRVAMSPVMFCGNQDFYALISSHRDGKILKNIVTKFNCGVIEGSTNKNPLGAIKEIIQKLSNGSNVIITPDGPRGPVYTVGSAITDIAKKYNKELIPVSCRSSKYFCLKSWDKLIMPLPFGQITVVVGAPVPLVAHKEQNDLSLTQALMNLDLPL